MLIAQTNAGYDFPEANRVVHLDAGNAAVIHVVVELLGVI